MQQSLPCTLQIRNNAVIQYYDTSYLDFKRGGNKQTLKQNLKTKLKSKLNELNKVEVVENINDFERKYKKIYSRHSQSLKSQAVDLKDFGILSKNQVRSLKKNVENLVNFVTINYDYKKSVKNQKFLAFCNPYLTQSAEAHG